MYVSSLCDHCCSACRCLALKPSNTLGRSQKEGPTKPGVSWHAPASPQNPSSRHRATHPPLKLPLSQAITLLTMAERAPRAVPMALSTVMQAPLMDRQGRSPGIKINRQNTRPKWTGFGSSSISSRDPTSRISNRITKRLMHSSNGCCSSSSSRRT